MDLVTARKCWISSPAAICFTDLPCVAADYAAAHAPDLHTNAAHAAAGPDVDANPASPPATYLDGYQRAADVDGHGRCRQPGLARPRCQHHAPRHPFADGYGCSLIDARRQQTYPQAPTRHWPAPPCRHSLTEYSTARSGLPRRWRSLRAATNPARAVTLYGSKGQRRLLLRHAV